MPANWDGHELREFLADKFDAERTLKRCFGSRTYRLKDYRVGVYNCNL